MSQSAKAGANMRDLIGAAAVVALCIAPSAAMNLWPGLSGVIWGSAATDGASVAKLVLQGVAVLVMALCLPAMDRARSWAKKLAALGLGLGLASLNFLNALEVASHARDQVATSARGTINGTAALERQLTELRKSRTIVPHHSPATPAMVESAALAVSAAEWSRQDECKRRGNNCRDREADERRARAELVAIQERRGLTDKAAALDASISELEGKLALAGPVPKYEDPAAHRLAVVFERLGFDLGDKPAEVVAEYWPILIAVMVEVLAMVGPYILLGSNPTLTSDLDAATSSHHEKRSAKLKRSDRSDVVMVNGSSTTHLDAPRQSAAPAAVAPITAVAQSPASPAKSRKPRASKAKPAAGLREVREWYSASVIARDNDLKCGEAFQHYKEWCQAEGVQPVSMTAFGNAMRDDLKVEKITTPSKRNFYRGIALKPAKPSLVAVN